MISGYVTFYWHDGHKSQVPLLRNLKGLKHNNRRPINYSLMICAGNISAVEAVRLNEWLNQLPAAITIPQIAIHKKASRPLETLKSKGKEVSKRWEKISRR